MAINRLIRLAHADHRRAGERATSTDVLSAGEMREEMLEVIDIMALAGVTSSCSLDPSESPVHVQIVTSDSVRSHGFAFKSRGQVASSVVCSQYCASESAENWA